MKISGGRVYVIEILWYIRHARGQQQIGQLAHFKAFVVPVDHSVVNSVVLAFKLVPLIDDPNLCVCRQFIKLTHDR